MTPDSPGSAVGAPKAKALTGGLWAPIRNRFVAAAGGLSVVPLAVLFALNFVDEFDSSAFAVLAPEIKAFFRLDNRGFSGVLAINFLLVLSLSVLVGYLGDRYKRVRLVQAGALVAGIGSIATGLAPVLWMLILARLVNGAGVLVNGPIHKSLLADYYAPENRGNVFALHEAANPFGRAIAPAVVGGLAAITIWQAPFFVFAIPLFVFLLLSMRLPEPVRGGTDRAEEAVQADQEAPVRFGRAVRMLSQARTLRRVWLGLVFVGAGLIPLLSFLAIFYDTVFDAGPVARGVFASVGSIAGLLGLMVAGRVVRLLLERRGPAMVQLFSGATLAALAPLLIVFALQRWLVGAVLIGTIIAFIGGFYWPAAHTVQSLVAPPRVRSQGFAFGFLFLAVGALLAPISANVADTDGLRWGIVAFSPFLFVGGLVIASAYRFVPGDYERAVQTLETTALLRKERLSAAKNSLLLCRDIDVSYGAVQVLFGVDFEVKEGEIVALLGTNGAGKSTLLKAIAGSLSPDRGLIFFDGEEVSAMTAWEASRRGIVLMPGGKSIFPTMSVAENLRLAAWLYRRDSGFVRTRIPEVLEIFPRLAERIDTPAGNLSGGEQQMVSLAQALIAKPKLLMIDELSLGLAPKVVSQLLDIVRAIHDRGVTIILVEQSVNVALTIAKHAYFMEKGEIRYNGPTDQLLSRRDILRAVFLEGAAKVAGETLT